VNRYMYTNMTYGLSCLNCKTTWDVWANFDLNGPATYCHCPGCLKLVKLWGLKEYYIFDEEDAFV